MVHGSWFRDQLICPRCKSIPRERALAFVLSNLLPDWRKLAIHESSPADRGISSKLKRECNNYIASQFYPENNQTRVGDFHNVNLERQGFKDEVFDIFISLDVMEHVFNPKQAILEIYRTLKPGAYAVMTFPIQ
jgi:SAM-dependent methyltransferase